MFTVKCIVQIIFCSFSKKFYTTKLTSLITFFKRGGARATLLQSVGLGSKERRARTRAAGVKPSCPGEARDQARSLRVERRNPTSASRLRRSGRARVPCHRPLLNFTSLVTESIG